MGLDIACLLLNDTQIVSHIMAADNAADAYKQADMPSLATWFSTIGLVLAAELHRRSDSLDGAVDVQTLIASAASGLSDTELVVLERGYDESRPRMLDRGVAELLLMDEVCDILRRERDNRVLIAADLVGGQRCRRDASAGCFTA